MTVNTELFFPEHIADMREFRELAKSYDKSLQPVWEVFDSIYKNRFFDTLDEEGCARHEKLLGISANPIDELDDRRRRIKGYYTSNLPYTEKKMNEVLTAMCGEDGYDLVIDKRLKTITVNIKLNSISLVNNVEELMKRMRPCDMVLAVEIIYNIYARFRTMTHEAMGGYTHEQLRASKVFMKDFNMYCTLARYTHGQLAGYTHDQLQSDPLNQ